MDLNHLHLKVRSVEAAKAFYARWFGLSEHVWHGDMVFMRDGSGMDLALAPAAEPAAMPEWFHFGFRLERAPAVEALHDALVGAGVPITEPLMREPDLVSFRCADPDGYSIEVYWETQPA
jgi:catechol 2,3-dioxygenase-like lactoylglutathione lyase family enzyme